MKICRSKFAIGFTLVEVVVVIAIIGILTVIIFPEVNKIRAKNRDAERVSDIATIQIGLSMYYSKNGAYPNDLSVPGIKFIPTDALTGPAPFDHYEYVPLTRKSGGTTCSYYHLGVELELPKAQVDENDKVVSGSVGSADARNLLTEGYYYCSGYTSSGIDGSDASVYDVRP